MFSLSGQAAFVTGAGRPKRGAGRAGRAVVYLASEAGAFTTGATLDLNGGRLMR